MTKESWKELGFKDKAQYILSLSFGFASILLAFLSFLLLMYIPASVITMSTVFASFALAIVGVGIYFKNQLVEFQTKCNKRFDMIDEEIENKRLKLSENVM